MVSDVTHISKILMTLLDKKIAKQPIGTSKKLHMVFKTNLLGLNWQKFCLCSWFDTQLIRLENHFPFRIVAFQSVYHWITLKRNNFCWIVYFITFPFIYGL